jgi:hypothetical protein
MIFYICMVHVLCCLVFEMCATSLGLFALFKSFGWCILFHFLFKCTLLILMHTIELLAGQVKNTFMDFL